MGKAFDDAKVLACREQLCASFKEILKHFTDVPQSERIITSFRCKFYGEKKGMGRVYVTHNFLLFLGNSKDVIKAIVPTRLIDQIEKGRSPRTGLLPAVNIILDHGEKKTFSHVYYRHDLFTIIKYIIKHPQYFVALPTKQEKPEKKLVSSDEGQKAVPKNLKNDIRSESEPVIDGRWRDFMEEEEKKQYSASDYEKVDVATAISAEKIANDIINIQLQTREKIAEDATKIDHIEQ